ncbi:MAG: 3-hydroxyacyl-ACP dehydratase FabZ [Rhodospirillales bacterium]|jgi:3-hydroxyacyl-[acyl-carrier-protein] dehydratase|tara:strand:- start:31 stop:492 length:462 start_codon:yes stop_codon:yes gene_type:complete
MDNETTSEIPTIEVDEIMQMIPHRYPFLLIDRVKDVVFDTSAVGIKNVTVNEPFFQGHFPGHPIMPGVLLIEAMAQTSAVLVIKTTGKVAGSVVYFMTVDNARFRKPVRPGDQVKLHVEKVRNRGNVWKFKGEARVDGKLMAEAAYSAMIVDS